MGGSAASLTLRGALADINAFIAAGSLRYLGAADATADVALTIGIDDLGNAGSGGARSDSVVRTITIAAVNDTPAISAPAILAVSEDQATALSGIVFSDADAGGFEVQASFQVGTGSLQASSGAGVTVGGSAASLTLRGALADINAFIAAGSLRYLGAADATADVALTIGIDDLGNAGSGGARSDSVVRTITIQALDDAPRPNGVIDSALLVQNTITTFQIRADSLVDPDAGDALTFSTSLADGSPLPAWLVFDASSRTFTAAPGSGDLGTIQLRLVATDLSGRTGDATFSISVQVPAAEPVPEAVEVDAATSTAQPAPVSGAGASSGARAELAGNDLAGEPAATEQVAESVSTLPAGDGPGGFDALFELPPGRLQATAESINLVVAVPQGSTVEPATATPVPNVPLLADALLQQVSDTAPTSSSTPRVQNEDMTRRLQEMRRQLADSAADRQAMMVSGIALSSGASIGYVIWLIRGGVLVSSMVSALPAWQMIDPLPVVAARGTRRRPGASATGDDPEIEELFDEHGEPQRPGRRGGTKDKVAERDAADGGNA